MDRDEHMSSLNQVLKWSVEESTKQGREARPVDPGFVENHREIINALFSNEYEEIEKLRVIVANRSVDLENRLEALETLEEFAQDLNYAKNFKKVGILKTLVDLYDAEENDKVKIMLVWILGTCMQDVSSIKEDVLSLNGANVLCDALDSQNPKLRAKAVMASSALMKNSPELAEQVKSSGVLDKLVLRLRDEDSAVQSRAIFLLEHSRNMLCDYFAEKAAEDQEVVSALLDKATSAEGEDAAKAVACAILPSEAGRRNLRALDAQNRVPTAAKTLSEPEHKKALLDVLVKTRQ
mmetsp:Transcript_10984/g.33693  ORF Transcript_10984/g.33693 Transcript_10984/m.33693 type:complete len:294 (-) Transcript_10984:45-926(-)